MVTVFLFLWIFADPRLFFNQIILGLILIAQVIELIRFVNHTNRELTRFFLAIKHQDFSISFKQTPLGNSFSDLQQSMSGIIESYKQVKIEKEAQYHFLQFMVNQLQVGIIALTNNDIVLINPTAERLLQIQGIRNWKLVQQHNPSFAEEFRQIGDSGRKLIESITNGETKFLTVDVSTHTVLDLENKIITLQDINAEIEQKEIEAWHKLIRILTHEIMNSITPIASLTETMQSMLTDKSGGQKILTTLGDETISDIRFSLNTIQNRSEGLLRFVENYRKLTRIPKPDIELVVAKTFLSSIDRLMKESLQRKDINLSISVDDESLTVMLDPSLMEQVIINLLTNSTYALENVKEKSILIKAYKQENHTIIEVTDNGKGIPEKEMKEIFIPFYSTRPDGSGIGLSLSKQIVSQHGGRISVSSISEKYTSFYIRLRTN
jgi:nitrogen fixation/metabolism regulation signal transduction histidine kinase